MKVNKIFEQIKTLEGRKEFRENTKREAERVKIEREKNGIYSTNVIKKEK